MKYCSRAAFFLFLFVFPFASFATSLSTPTEKSTFAPSFSPYIQAAAGTSIVKSRSGKIHSYPHEWDRLDSKDYFPILYHVGVGYQYAIPGTQYFLKNLGVGLDAYYSVNRNGQGQVYWYELLPNSDYRLKSHSIRLMLDLQADLLHFKSFSPFVLVGVGSAWNTVDRYEEIQHGMSTGEGVYGKKTTANFSYQFGAGLRYAFSQHFQMFIEYLYVNAGILQASKKYDSGNVVRGARFDLREHQFLLGLRYYF